MEKFDYIIIGAGSAGCVLTNRIVNSNKYKVLLIEDIMDKTKDNLGDLKVSKDEIIENVAEKILTQEKSVAVVDNNNNIIGSINPAKIINTVFGGRKNNI